MKNLTALFSCYARYYHHRFADGLIFDDPMAEHLLRPEEIEEIEKNLMAGAGFFLPDSDLTGRAALDRIVNQMLAPSVLIRSAFCRRAVQSDLPFGLSQGVILGAGLDAAAISFGKLGLICFELDLPEAMTEKKKRYQETVVEPPVLLPCDFQKENWKERLLSAGYQRGKRTLVSAMGLTYYLKKETWSLLLQSLSKLLCEGSSVCFDFPMPGFLAGKIAMLANGAGEEMQAVYSADEMVKQLEANGFLLYEFLSPKEAEEAFCKLYAEKYPNNPIHAPKDVGYCLAVRKG